MDKATLERIKTAHPKLRDELLLIYTEIEKELGDHVMCRFAFVFRSITEQDGIFAQGRTRPGKIVTNAKGGKSYHNYGLAVDVVLLLDTDKNGSHETASWDFTKDFDKDGFVDWKEIDKVFTKYGWKGLYKKNGQRWDLPHFQKTFGYSISTLQMLVAKGKVYPGTQYPII